MDCRPGASTGFSGLKYIIHPILIHELFSYSGVLVRAHRVRDGTNGLGSSPFPEYFAATGSEAKPLAQ